MNLHKALRNLRIRLFHPYTNGEEYLAHVQIFNKLQNVENHRCNIGKASPLGFPTEVILDRNIILLISILISRVVCENIFVPSN